MMKKAKKDHTEQRKNGFWPGLCLGVFCSLFFATLFVYTFFSVQGVRIELDRHLPALSVRDRIKEEAFTEFNLLLEKLKVELPVTIRRAFQNPERLFIPYEEGAVSLPRGVGEAAREQFQKLAENSVIEFLQGVDLTPYIEELGQAALAEAMDTLNREVAGKIYHYQVNPLLAIPVTVSSQ